VTAALARHRRPDVAPYADYPRNYPPAFVRFHDANPDVYAGMVAEARSLKLRGYVAVGVKWLLENRRYQPDEPPGDRIYRALNNSFATLYGRLMEAQEEDLRGYFRLRCRSGESAAPDPKQTEMEFD
jgi:hypothetical protein